MWPFKSKTNNRIRYEITHDGPEDVDIWAYIGTTLVGRANGLTEDDRRMRLADIIVGDRDNKWRRRGIGTEMLKKMVAECKRLNMIEMYGSITKDDVDRSPFLLSWYSRHGFTVSAPDADCVPAALHKITLTL